MTTPFITNLKKHYPKAQIDYCCYKNNANLLEDDKRINKIIKRKENSLISLDFLNTIRIIKNNKYDLCINLYHAQHSAFLTILSNARYKMGNIYNTSCTTNNLAVNDSQKTRDVRLNAKHIAEQLGISNYDETVLSIKIKEEHKKEIFQIFKKLGIKKQVIGINANAAWIAKTWPKEHWISLINKISKQYKKYNIIMFGGPEDKKVSDEIFANINNKKHIFNLAGKLSLKQTAAALQNISVFITGDTGPTHIAITVKTKTIALFGVTDPKRIIGRAKYVHVLSKYESCPDIWKYNHNNEPPKEAQEQIAKITPDVVMEKLKEILK